MTASLDNLKILDFSRVSVTGPADGEPQKVGVALVDVLGGLFATVGILAAVRHRDRTHQGQRVEVNLLSSLLAALVNQGSSYTIAGLVPERMGTRIRASLRMSCSTPRRALSSSPSATIVSSPRSARSSERRPSPRTRTTRPIPRA
jgi:crotonobetainyl-CoA:carnitine CoA-transferase CaiB-like acyl-CoA transferase